MSCRTSCAQIVLEQGTFHVCAAVAASLVKQACMFSSTQQSNLSVTACLTHCVPS